MMKVLVSLLFFIGIASAGQRLGRVGDEIILALRYTNNSFPIVEDFIREYSYGLDDDAVRDSANAIMAELKTNNMMGAGTPAGSCYVFHTVSDYGPNHNKSRRETRSTRDYPHCSKAVYSCTDNTKYVCVKDYHRNGGTLESCNSYKWKKVAYGFQCRLNDPSNDRKTLYSGNCLYSSLHTIHLRTDYNCNNGRSDSPVYKETWDRRYLHDCNGLKVYFSNWTFQGWGMPSGSGPYITSKEELLDNEHHMQVLRNQKCAPTRDVDNGTSNDGYPVVEDFIEDGAKNLDLEEGSDFDWTGYDEIIGKDAKLDYYYNWDGTHWGYGYVNMLMFRHSGGAKWFYLGGPKHWQGSEYEGMSKDDVRQYEGEQQRSIDALRMTNSATNEKAQKGEGVNQGLCDPGVDSFEFGWKNWALPAVYGFAEMYVNMASIVLACRCKKCNEEQTQALYKNNWFKCAGDVARAAIENSDDYYKGYWSSATKAITRLPEQLRQIFTNAFTTCKNTLSKATGDSKIPLELILGSENKDFTWTGFFKDLFTSGETATNMLKFSNFKDELENAISEVSRMVVKAIAAQVMSIIVTRLFMAAAGLLVPGPGWLSLLYTVGRPILEAIVKCPGEVKSLLTELTHKLADVVVIGVKKTRCTNFRDPIKALFKLGFCYMANYSGWAKKHCRKNKKGCQALGYCYGVFDLLRANQTPLLH